MKLNVIRHIVIINYYDVLHHIITLQLTTFTATNYPYGKYRCMWGLCMSRMSDR